MVKRLFWLTVGFWLGVGVTIHATRTLRRSVERYLPPGGRRTAPPPEHRSTTGLH